MASHLSWASGHPNHAHLTSFWPRHYRQGIAPVPWERACARSSHGYRPRHIAVAPAILHSSQPIDTRRHRPCRRSVTRFVPARRSHLGSSWAYNAKHRLKYTLSAKAQWRPIVIAFQALCHQLRQPKTIRSHHSYYTYITVSAPCLAPRPPCSLGDRHLEDPWLCLVRAASSSIP